MARCTHSDCRTWRPDTLVRYGRLGLHVDGDWFCSSECVESATETRLLRARRADGPVPPIPALRLGVLLLHQGAITSADLTRALGAQRQSGRRLGAELLHLGLTDAASILRGLSAQAGISYLAAVDPACVRNAPGGLSPDEVRALGVVPIQANNSSRLLVVACQAPVPRAALSALRQLTGWAPEPLLVADAVLQTLMSHYGTAAPATERRMAFTTVQHVGDVAARVAAAAASVGAVTVTEAFSDSTMWVRIESPKAVDTLLMRRDGAGAATTDRVNGRDNLDSPDNLDNVNNGDHRDISEWPVATTSH